MSRTTQIIIAVAAGLACLILLFLLAPTKIQVDVKLGGSSTSASSEAQAPVADSGNNNSYVAPATEVATEAPATEAATQATAPEATTAAQAPAANDTATTAPAAQQTTPAVSSGNAASDSAMSKAEIVALYNTAVNKVKTSAKQVTRNYKKLSCPDDGVELPSAIQGIGKTAIGTFVKGTDTPESWTSMDDIKIVFPVGNTDYCSKLTADMVESATIKDNGTTYTITLKLYDDKITSPEKGQGYAACFNTITASTITSVSIPTVTFNKVDVNGINGSIVATVDKANSRVTKATFFSTDVMKINVKVVVSTLDCKITMVQEEDFSIDY